METLKAEELSYTRSRSLVHCDLFSASCCQWRSSVTAAADRALIAAMLQLYTAICVFFLIPTRTPILSALHSAILPGTPASRFPSRFRSSCDREIQRADTFEGEMQRCQSCCIASLSHLFQQPTSCLFKTKGPRRKERSGLSSGSKSAARGAPAQVGANNNKLQEKQKKKILS